jgi:hypothetical protein
MVNVVKEPWMSKSNVLQTLEMYKVKCFCFQFSLFAYHKAYIINFFESLLVDIYSEC